MKVKMSIKRGDVVRFYVILFQFGLLTFIEFDKEWGRWAITASLTFMVAFSVSDFISRNMAIHRFNQMFRDQTKEGKEEMKRTYKAFIKNHPEMKSGDDEDGET